MCLSSGAVNLLMGSESKVNKDRHSEEEIIEQRSNVLKVAFRQTASQWDTHQFPAWLKSSGTIFEKFSNVFEGLGCFDPLVSPSMAALIRQPLALKKEISTKLNRLKKLGATVKVT